MVETRKKTRITGMYKSVKGFPHYMIFTENDEILMVEEYPSIEEVEYEEDIPSTLVLTQFKIKQEVGQND